MPGQPVHLDPLPGENVGTDGHGHVTVLARLLQSQDEYCMATKEKEGKGEGTGDLVRKL